MRGRNHIDNADSKDACFNAVFPKLDAMHQHHPAIQRSSGSTGAFDWCTSLFSKKLQLRGPMPRIISRICHGVQSRWNALLPALGVGDVMTPVAKRDVAMALCHELRERVDANM